MPSIELVTVLLLIFWTPLMTCEHRSIHYSPTPLTMHMWLACTTTPTPAGPT